MSCQKDHKKAIHASIFQSFLQPKTFLLVLPLLLFQEHIDEQVLQGRIASQDKIKIESERLVGFGALYLHHDESYSLTKQ